MLILTLVLVLHMLIRMLLYGPCRIPIGLMYPGRLGLALAQPVLASVAMLLSR